MFFQETMSSTTDGNAHNRRDTGGRLRLYCFPYAGGNARSIFGDWQNELYFDADVVPVDLPGRGARAGEALLADLQPVAVNLAREIAAEVSGPYMFYGHSVGALVCFEVARQLSRHHGSEPDAIFAAAFRAPHTPSARAPVHGMDDHQLLAHVVRLGGVPARVLMEPDLLKLAFPTLRADLRLSETYELGDAHRLSCPIYVYGGEADPIVASYEFERWRDLTSGECEVRMFKGGHFFLEVSQHALFEHMACKQRALLRGCR